MLRGLTHLQESLSCGSYSLVEALSAGGQSSISLPWGGSFVLFVPYVALLLVDIGAYVIAFALMFEYSRGAQSSTAAALGRRISQLSIKLGLALLMLCLVASFVAFSGSEVGPVYFFGGLYVISLASQSWKTLILAIWVMWSAFFTRRYPAHLSEIIILASFALSFGLSLISANNFILLFLFLEGLSLVSYVMAASARQYGNVAGAVQYFIYGSLGSILLLLGIVALYSSFYNLSLSVWAQLIKLGLVLTYSEALQLYSASFLMALGLLIKFGAAPLHGWVVEVYASLSYHVMWFFSVFTKLILGLVLLRVLSSTLVFGLVELMGALSLVLGCLGALRQSEVKRLFAYGSVMHVGFLALAGYTAFQVYLVAYVLSALLIGLAITNLRLNGQEVTYLSDVARALPQASPACTFAIVIGLLSMGGVPPLGGFWGKFAVISTAFSGSSPYSGWAVAIVAVMLISTLVAFFYYFRLAVWVCLGLGSTRLPEPNLVSRGVVVTLVALSVTLLAFGVLLLLFQDVFYAIL